MFLLNTTVKADSSFSAHLKNLETCTPSKHTIFAFVQVEQEVLGWYNDSCVIRNVYYTYNVPRNVKITSFDDFELLKSYIVPERFFTYRLTKKQLAAYHRATAGNIGTSGNKSTVKISTKNMKNASNKNTRTKIKPCEHYEYKNGSWVRSNRDDLVLDLVY